MKRKKVEFPEVALISEFNTEWFGKGIMIWQIELLYSKNPQEGGVRLTAYVPYTALELFAFIIPISRWQKWLEEVNKAAKKIEKRRRRKKLEKQKS